MGRLRIALLQLTSRGRDVDANLALARTWFRRAAGAGADVALLPELWSVGYQGFVPDDPEDPARWRALALRADDARIAGFGALAQELGIALALPYLEETGAGVRNTVTLFDRHGDVRLHYAKVHLAPWSPPDTGCVAGADFPVCTLDTTSGPVQVGIMTCFDREFPEAARRLGLAGAELVLVPNACDLAPRPGGFGPVRVAQLQGRAFENLLAVAMTNYAAPQEDGRSLLCDADGTILVEAGPEETLVVAELDLASLRALREREALRRVARRPELYGELAAETLVRPEAPGDAAACDAIHRRAFGREAEAAIAARLRAEARPYLGLVAEHRGRLAGHAALSPVAADGVTELALGLGPMAVVPERQRQGVGGALVRAAISAAGRAGAGHLFVLGHPAYYPRFGFRPALALGFRYGSAEHDDAFFVLEIPRNSAPERAPALVRYHAAFDADAAPRPPRRRPPRSA